jgi:hypothetical protein
VTLSADFNKELGDALIANLAAKAKHDVMGVVVEHPATAIEMLELVTRSAGSLISAFCTSLPNRSETASGFRLTYPYLRLRAINSAGRSQDCQPRS